MASVMGFHFIKIYTCWKPTKPHKYQDMGLLMQLTFQLLLILFIQAGLAIYMIGNSITVNKIRPSSAGWMPAICLHLFLICYERKGSCLLSRSLRGKQYNTLHKTSHSNWESGFGDLNKRMLHNSCCYEAPLIVILTFSSFLFWDYFCIPVWFSQHHYVSFWSPQTSIACDVVMLHICSAHPPGRSAKVLHSKGFLCLSATSIFHGGSVSLGWKAATCLCTCLGSFFFVFGLKTFNPE